MRFNCPACRQPLEIADELARGDVRCPACGQVVRPPAPAAPADATAMADAPVVEPPRASGLAVSSLVLGILGLLIGWACCGILLPVLAIVFGHIALSQIRRDPRGLTGRGMAIAGLVLGYTGLVVSIVVGIAFGLFSAILEAASTAG